MNSKILITGSNGFIGQHLSLYLKKFKIFGIGNKRKAIFQKTNIYSKNINGKITSQKLLAYFKNIDIIIHCAGSGLGLNYEDDFNKNVLPTFEILKYINKLKKKPKIIFVSTLSVYKSTTKKIEEEDLVRPSSIYAKNKKSSEDILKLFSKIYKFDLLIARTASLYGVGLERQLIHDACKKLENKNFKFNGTGQEIRDWLHINDMCNLVYKFVLKDFKNINIINCGTGNGNKVKSVIEIIKKIYRIKNKIKYNKILDSNPSKMVANISKAKKYNWKPTIFLKDGINEYVEWYKKKIKN